MCTYFNIWEIPQVQTETLADVLKLSSAESISFIEQTIEGTLNKISEAQKALGIKVFNQEKFDSILNELRNAMKKWDEKTSRPNRDMLRNPLKPDVPTLPTINSNSGQQSLTASAPVVE